MSEITASDKKWAEDIQAASKKSPYGKSRTARVLSNREASVGMKPYKGFEGEYKAFTGPARIMEENGKVWGEYWSLDMGAGQRPYWHFCREFATEEEALSWLHS